MQVCSAQEALFIAIEMERGAVQLYERALALMEELGRSGEPLYAHLCGMLADEKQHLSKFRALYMGLDAELERRLTLSAIAASVLFEGGLMGAVRAGLLSGPEEMYAFAVESEKKAAATYRSFAEQSEDEMAAGMLRGIAAEEDKHLETLREQRSAL